MTQIPADWQTFYQEVLPPGMAAFELFPDRNQETQPILLVHAPPEMYITSQPLLSSTVEIHTVEQIRVVRVILAISSSGEDELMDLLLHLFTEEPKVQHLTIPLDTTTRFETFLNPYEEDQREILQKLAEAPTLAVSLIQSNRVCWGKRFPWSEEIRHVVREVLKQTSPGAVSVQQWMAAKEQVLETSRL